MTSRTETAHRDPERHALWELADELQRDLRTAAARLTALRSHLSALELPDPQQVQCTDCGLRLSGPLTLAEHRYHSHAGPEPEHWVELKARLAPDKDEAATG